MPLDRLRGTLTACVLLALAAPSPAAGPPASPAHFARDVQPLLNAYCVRCHGGKTKRGGVDLANIPTGALTAKTRLWQRALEQVRSGDMPPALAKQPTPAQRALLAGWLTQTLAAAERDRTPQTDPGPSLARRLTRTEYERTIRDLVGIDFNAGEAVGLTDDHAGSGFDNLASRLTLSATQMEKYFAAADMILERVLGRPDGKPAGGGFNRGQAEQARKTLLFVQPSDKLAPRAAARQVVERFARRAFRRPVRPAEIDRLMRLYDLAQKKGDRKKAERTWTSGPVNERDNHNNGVRLLLKAVLVSPHFLLRIEQDRAGRTAGYPVSDHELAVRLSYFLWSTMPDDALTKLADEGRLSAPGVLDQQIKRMLADHRARSLTDNFGMPFLQLRKILEARPSQEFFPAFTHGLRYAMWDEAVTFFDRLRLDDQPVLDLLDADYTFVNEELAKHYGLPGVKGGNLRKVALKPADRRGGLLGMAGVLTMTSHTSRTSPTLRGKWVLDVLLGAPPPPPPPDAGVLKEEKQKGKAPRTFRELMAAHATQASCAGCHKKMDPLGYALDNFDGIGRWRDQDGTHPIDSVGVLPTGERFTGPAGLKQLVWKRREAFVRNLTEHLFVYALGRELQDADDQAVRLAMTALADHKHRFGALVRAVVHSYPFRHRRNAAADD